MPQASRGTSCPSSVSRGHAIDQLRPSRLLSRSRGRLLPSRPRLSSASPPCDPFLSFFHFLRPLVSAIPRPGFVGPPLSSPHPLTSNSMVLDAVFCVFLWKVAYLPDPPRHLLVVPTATNSSSDVLWMFHPRFPLPAAHCRSRAETAARTLVRRVLTVFVYPFAQLLDSLNPSEVFNNVACSCSPLVLVRLAAC